MENQPVAPNNFDHLFELEKIEKHHVANLSPQQKAAFNALVQQKLAVLKDKERDDFIEKIRPIIDNRTLWEYNHDKITEAIAHYIEDFGAMPAKAEISRTTGLSLKTIRQHLSSYKQNPAYQEQEEAFGLMAPKVLSIVMKKALKGDMQAAKLFLHIQSTQTDTNEVVIQNQNNNIQINNTVISQQILQQLKPEQLQQIEQIIQKYLAEQQQ
ncbi:MAG: hypothetical protein JWO06_377 [Bacteroidota bacterium]|nr:hypothetical protein [Bacteroidota bacterium]